jgi:hypothetical protein
MHRLKNIDEREVAREMLRYRSIIFNKYADKDDANTLVEQDLKDTATLVLKRLKIQEQLLIDKKLWPYASYTDLLEDMKTTNRNRMLSLKNNEVIYGPVEFTEETFYDYQFSNAVIMLKRMMEGKEILINDTLLKEHFNKLKQSIYAHEKYTFEKMKRQVKDAYIEEQYSLLIDKLLSEY